MSHQVLSNYAVDEIYIRQTPSWMFLEEEVQRLFIKCCTRFFCIMFHRNKGTKKSLLISFKFYFEKWESMQKALQPTPSQAQEAFARFCKNLDEIEKKIEARNRVLVEGGKVPYTILLPSKIPAGIAV